VRHRRLSLSGKGHLRAPNRVAFFLVFVLVATAASIGLTHSPSAKADLGDPHFVWTHTGLAGRLDAALAFDEANGKAVLFGGTASGAVLGDTWTWDGSTWTRRAPAHSPDPRFSASAAYDAATGDVVLFGGRRTCDNCNPNFGDTWTWNGSDWHLESPPHSPPAAFGAAMTYDPVRQKVLLVGGKGLICRGCTGVGTWTWDGSDWTKQSPASPPPPRLYASLAFDFASGTAVLFGGQGIGGQGNCGLQPCIGNETWTWDGSEWTQQTPAHSPSARSQAAMASDPSGQGVTLFGGCPGFDDCGIGSVSSETWTWNGTDWVQGTPVNSPSARSGASAAYDSVRQEIVLFGGEDWAATEPVMGDTWTWNGSDWTLRSPAQNPAGRFDPALVYDDAHQQVVLYGGSSSGPFGDTWTWDGSGWVQQHPVSSPPRGAGVAAYDSVRQQTVLYGVGTCNCETWIWNGSEWASQAGGPRRFGAAMAFDAATGTTMLFGGETPEQYDCGADDAAQYPYPCAETWTWDGSSWTKESPAHDPPRRYGSSMAYDPIHDQVVLFGGLGPNDMNDMPTRRGDTWTWDGSDWTKQTPVNNPLPLPATPMAFDPATGTVILVQGAKTWSWDGSTWTDLSVPGGPLLQTGGGARLVFDSNANGLLFGAFDADPGPDGSTWHYGVKPVVSTTVDATGGAVSTPGPLDSVHPLRTTLAVGATPAGGKVSIAQTGATHRAPKGFGFLNAQAWIVMPRASLGSAHTLDFRLHPSLIAGDPGATLYVFRTGSSKPKEVGACISTPPPDPDPCVSDQHIAPDGAVHITVSTTSGPIWNFALPLVSRSVGITYKRRRHGFTGKVSSSKHACVAAQKVTVFRKRRGPDRKIGSDVTSSTGVYFVHFETSKGRYYAQVPRQMRSGVGFCGPATSSAIRA
jgi:hypothetical protein